MPLRADVCLQQGVGPLSGCVVFADCVLVLCHAVPVLQHSQTHCVSLKLGQVAG